MVVLAGKQRIREVPEELLYKTCNAIDVVVEVFRVREVDLR